MFQSYDIRKKGVYIITEYFYSMYSGQGFNCKTKQHRYRAIALKKIIFSKSKPYYLKWICYSTDISLTNSSTGWRNECIVFSSNFESGLFEVQVLEILILIIYTLCH